MLASHTGVRGMKCEMCRLLHLHFLSPLREPGRKKALRGSQCCLQQPKAVIEEIEQGCSQRCTVKERGDRHQLQWEKFCLYVRNFFSWRGWVSTATGRGRMRNFCPGIYLKSARARPWAAWIQFGISLGLVRVWTRRPTQVLSNLNYSMVCITKLREKAACCELFSCIQSVERKKNDSMIIFQNPLLCHAVN